MPSDSTKKPSTFNKVASGIFFGVAGFLTAPIAAVYTTFHAGYKAVSDKRAWSKRLGKTAGPIVNTVLSTTVGVGNSVLFSGIYTLAYLIAGPAKGAEYGYKHGFKAAFDGKTFDKEVGEWLKGEDADADEQKEVVSNNNQQVQASASKEEQKKASDSISDNIVNSPTHTQSIEVVNKKTEKDIAAINQKLEETAKVLEAAKEQSGLDLEAEEPKAVPLPAAVIESVGPKIGSESSVALEVSTQNTMTSDSLDGDSPVSEDEIQAIQEDIDSMLEDPAHTADLKKETEETVEYILWQSQIYLRAHDYVNAIKCLGQNIDKRTSEEQKFIRDFIEAVKLAKKTHLLNLDSQKLDEQDYEQELISIYNELSIAVEQLEKYNSSNADTIKLINDFKELSNKVEYNVDRLLADSDNKVKINGSENSFDLFPRVESILRNKSHEKIEKLDTSPVTFARPGASASERRQEEERQREEVLLRSTALLFRNEPENNEQPKSENNEQPKPENNQQPRIVERSVSNTHVSKSPSTKQNKNEEPGFFTKLFSGLGFWKEPQKKMSPDMEPAKTAENHNTENRDYLKSDLVM